MISAPLAIGALLTLAGFSGSGQSSGEQDADKTTVPAEETTPPAERVVASRLASAPTNCEGPISRSKPPGFGLLFGENPVWFGPYARYGRIEQSLHLQPDSPRTELGWRIKVLWLVSSKQDAPVTIRVGSMGGATPPLVELAGGSAHVSAVLDPNNPGAYSNPNTADFPSYVYFAEAGCFFFDATWPGGK